MQVEKIIKLIRKKRQKLQLKGKKNISFNLSSLLFLVLAVIFLSFSFYILNDLPSPTKLSKGEFPTSTLIFDRNGILLYEIYTEQNRTPISLKDLPPYILEATISIEDKDFYKHRGLAFRGITRALYNIIFKKNIQGGSTITQQLIKTTLLSPERTIKRKIREAILASLTEIIYSKDQILEMYLNHVPYGGTAYGIEQAAKTYFAKSAKNLSLAEAALLAGLPAAPTRYSPFGAQPQLAKQRQKQVLEQMAEEGYIDKKEAENAFKEELFYAPQTTSIKAPHFVMYVKDILVEKYGQKMVEQGGLRVITSLDLPIQEYVQQIIASETAKLKKLNVSNAAALVTKPQTGEILAMVGSRNYFDEEIEGKVNITTSLRQPGSTIKPINYATGLINQHTAATLFFDIPMCFNSPGQGRIYCPHNYDGKFHGPVTMRSALANSYNLPAVQMLALNGIKAMMATAKMMGISTWSEDSSYYGLSLTLGGGEVKMTDMAIAFGVFANMGKKVELHPILKVEDYKGNIYELFDEGKVEKKLVLNPAVCYLISHILADDNARTPMFGRHSLLYIPGHQVAVKTGTTDHPQGPRDNWTIGYTPSYLIAVWVGNNDNSSMNPYLVSGVTGAAPIWHKITSFLLENTTNEFWPKPENIIEAPTCVWQNIEKITENKESVQCSGAKELFISGTEKKQSVSFVEKKAIFVDKETQRPPEAGKTDNLESKEHLVGSGPFVKEYCFTCPHEGEKPIIVNLNEQLVIGQ